MPAQFTSMFGRLGTSIRNFTLGQKVLAIIGVLVLGLGAAGLSIWLTKPSYVPMFTGLTATDASSIVDQLNKDGVSYQIGDGGASILVPQADVYTERMKAAAAGLPTTNAGGYSLLDKMGVTTSEFQQNVTYQRAVEGELAKTIEGIKGVTTASVKLAIPKDSVFSATKSSPTASVFVATGGSGIGGSQVQAIVNLVSASVQGLTAQNVSVVDASGNVLSAVGTGTSGNGSQQTTAYETRIQNSVQAMLDKVLGAGKSTVVITADVSAATGTATSETYTIPTGAPALTDSTTTETYGNGTGTGTTANSGAGGLVGVDQSTTTSVATGASSSSTASKSNGYISSSSNKANALNKTTQTTTIPGGTVTKQTVSVAVDSALPQGVTVQQIQDLVTTAAGIDTKRGDSITVAAVPFTQASAQTATDALAQAQAADQQTQLTTIITTAITAGGIIIAVALGLILLGRMLRRPARESIDLGELTATGVGPIGGGAAAAVMPGGNPMASLLAAADGADSLPLGGGMAPGGHALGLPGMAPATAGAPAAAQPVPGRARAEVSSLAQRDPDRAATLLRTMIDEPVGR